MNKITNINEATESAKKFVDKLQEPQVEQKNIFEEIMTQIKDINPELGGFDELASLLSLPEDQFALIAPIFIDEMGKSLNNINDRLLMVQAMNSAGLKGEDLRAEYTALIDNIDKQFTELPAIKKDFLKQMLGLTYNLIADAEGIAKKVINIPIELSDARAKMPLYANNGDSGLDVFALEDVTIAPGETKLIKTGLKVALPYGYELQVRPKSGLSLKTKMRIANTPGTIDSTYRGEIGVIIDNIDPPIKSIEYDEVWKDGQTNIDHLNITSITYGSNIHIAAGQKFAQLVLMEVPKAAFYQIEHVSDDTTRGEGGYGSTGI